MGRRKGEDSIASRKRRMPFVAKIRRDDPFRLEDEREIEAMCRRIAAAGEFMSLAGWREDAGGSACSTSRPGRRLAPCSTGLIAAALRTSQCRSLARQQKNVWNNSMKRWPGASVPVRPGPSCRPIGKLGSAAKAS